MSKEIRRDKIYEIVKNSKIVSVEELSDCFKVTEETIRKDLTYLSDKGLVMRTFGGAAIKEYGGERPLEQRMIQNYQEKQKIAAEAFKLIQPNDLVVMDAGSTVMLLAQNIQQNSGVVVITNSLEITNSLSKMEGITVVCTGGKLRSKSMSFQGAHTENAIRSYNVQKAFISCAAVDLKKGIMDTNEDEVRVKNCMIEEAKEVYVLADSSKINSIAHVTTCEIAKITAVITDDGIDKEIVRDYTQAGVRMIIAK
jgi:DeoR/GlpR family transcriptional regulator of sugar metabolism